MVRPVADKWFMTDEELAEERRLAHARAAAEVVGAAAPANGGPTSSTTLLLTWLAVGIPLAWGVYRTLLSVARFFH